MSKQLKAYSPDLVSSGKMGKQAQILSQLRRPSLKQMPNTSLPKIKGRQAAQKMISNISSTEKVVKSRSSISHSRLQNSFEPKYQWVHKSTDYASLQDSQIKDENSRLHNALRQLDREVDDLMESVSSKIEKNMNKIRLFNSRATTEGSTYPVFDNELDHRKQIQNREGINNDFILKLCKKEYMRLKKRQKFITGQDEGEIQKANTAVMIVANSRCRQKLQTSIDETLDSIAKTKEVNKKIKYRNKTLGDSIHATDEFIDGMKKLQFQVDFQNKNRIRLQKKLHECQSSVQQIQNKLSMIKNQSDIAEQFLLVSSKKQKDEELLKEREASLKKKEQEKILKNKKKDLQSQNKQMTYHALLMNLDELNESIKKIDEQVNKLEAENRVLKAEQKTLETKLQKIKMLKKFMINEAKVGLMLLSNELDDSQKEMGSQYSIPMNQSNGHRNDPNKKPQNLLTSNLRKQRNQNVECQTELEEKSPKFNNDSEISSINEQETKNSPLKIRKDCTDRP